MNERERLRRIDLGELCTHGGGDCYECLKRRHKRALDVIALQSFMFGVVLTENAYAREGRSVD
jgi:hypothetical protein